MGYFKEIKDNFMKLHADSLEVQENLRIAKDEAFNADRVGKSIKRSISEFEFTSQGHIDKINEILVKYSKTEKP